MAPRERVPRLLKNQTWRLSQRNADARSRGGKMLSAASRAAGGTPAARPALGGETGGGPHATNKAWQ